jgi:hypothetical protein
MLDAGCWMLDAGYSMIDTGYWMLDAGCVKRFQVSAPPLAASVQSDQMRN